MDPCAARPAVTPQWLAKGVATSDRPSVGGLVGLDLIRPDWGGGRWFFALTLRTAVGVEWYPVLNPCHLRPHGAPPPESWGRGCRSVLSRGLPTGRCTPVEATQRTALLSPLRQEILGAYAAAAARTEPPPPPVGLQLADYTLWEAEWLHSSEAARPAERR